MGGEVVLEKGGFYTASAEAINPNISAMAHEEQWSFMHNNQSPAENLFSFLKKLK